MMNLRFSFLEACALCAFTVALLVPSFAPVAVAADDDESMSLLPATPDWVERLDVSGRYAHVFGSEAKFREDQNIQSGAELGARAFEEGEDGRLIFFEGLVDPVEQQGFGRFDYEKLGSYSFETDVQAWTEFYNTRPGVEDVTVNGTRLDDSGVFPFTTNSRSLFGGGKPNVDWLTLKAGLDVELPGPFNDAYANFMYRTVKGEMSYLKGGTITDPLAVPVVVAGSGPGTVYFDFPGRKDTDVETIGGLAGTRSSLGGIAWRFDATAHRHEFKTDLREANFGTSAALSELESFREDTEIVTASANLVGSRQVTPELFLYGGGVFAFAESEPEPTQAVQIGFFPAATNGLLTRFTNDSEVTRFSEAVNAGLVYQMMPSVVMTADVAVRASQQEGELSETRQETALLTGDTGNITNDSNRDHLSVLAKAEVRWKAARRLSFEGHASYRYAQDEVDSTRVFAFVVAEAPEIEDYDMNRERVNVGASGRYRLKGGRRLDVGYDFRYEGSETDVNRLQNQFLVADYTRLRHTAYARLFGRITRKLRGDLRLQYDREDRDMDAPLVNAIVLGTADNGEVEFNGWTVAPTLTYQHSPELSGYVNLVIGQQQWDLANGAAAPGRFSSFEYDTVTQTGTIGANWNPDGPFSGNASYTIYANQKSVENFGHNARIRGSYALTEEWNLNGGIRYLGYQPDENTLDDYDTIIVTMGFTGTF